VAARPAISPLSSSLPGKGKVWAAITCTQLVSHLADVPGGEGVVLHAELQHGVGQRLRLGHALLRRGELLGGLRQLGRAARASGDDRRELGVGRRGRLGRGHGRDERHGGQDGSGRGERAAGHPVWDKHEVGGA